MPAQRGEATYHRRWPSTNSVSPGAVQLDITITGEFPNHDTASWCGDKATRRSADCLALLILSCDPRAARRTHSGSGDDRVLVEPGAVILDGKRLANVIRSSLLRFNPRPLMAPDGGLGRPTAGALVEKEGPLSTKTTGHHFFSFLCVVATRR